jgi:hypothetical protein
MVGNSEQYEFTYVINVTDKSSLGPGTISTSERPPWILLDEMRAQAEWRRTMKEQLSIMWTATKKHIRPDENLPTFSHCCPDPKYGLSAM